MKVKEAEEMIRVRISTVMRQKRITPSILARKTGISESVIRGYIQEGVVPTAGRLAVICEALKLDIAWVCGLRAGRRIKMSDYDISMCNFNVTTFEPLLGKLLVKIEGAEEGSGEIRFVLDNCCEFDGLDADIWADWMPNFCPHCGAPMTDKAVDMVMERLEALGYGKDD